MGEADAVLQVEGLSKRYKNQRGIENLCFEVREGDIYGFFGPNGAGKTTAMKMITGMCRADRGSVRIFGYDVGEQFERAMAGVGAVIETVEAYDFLSGYRNLELAARYYPGVRAARIDEVLEQVGLLPYKHERVRGYSLGMKQRLGVAGALLSRPRLLILDEPTNGMDIEGMVEIRELLLRLSREERVTILISSHMVQEMELMCSRVGILHGGRLIEDASMEAIRSGPAGSLERHFMERVKEERGHGSYAQL